MKKSELIDAIADANELTKADASHPLRRGYSFASRHNEVVEYDYSAIIIFGDSLSDPGNVFSPTLFEIILKLRILCDD